MKLILFIILIITFGCTGKNKALNPSLSSNIEQSNDSLIYIGFTNEFYFLESNEVYIDLYFNRKVNTYKEYDSISKLSKEVIYQDDDNSRNLISKKVSAENFDLRSLQEIYLFDSSNVLLGESSLLKSFEFLNQNISPKFIAVYQIQKNYPNIYYCIGGLKPTFSSIVINEITDSFSVSIIEKDFELNNIQTSFTLEHIQYLLNDSLIFTISNSDNYSFIHCTLNNKVDEIYKNNEYSNIKRVQFIPIFKNKMPILLCSLLVPETDIKWDIVLVYDGVKYIQSENQRVSINSFN